MNGPLKLEDFHCYTQRRISAAEFDASPKSRTHFLAYEQMLRALMTAALDRARDSGVTTVENGLFYEQTLDVYVVPPTLMYALIRDEALAMTRFMRYEPIPPAAEQPTWSQDDSTAAQAEGWDVFHVDDAQYEIQKCDEAERFNEDARAVFHVYDKALSGSELHRRALAFVLRDDNIKSLEGRNGT